MLAGSTTTSIRATVAVIPSPPANPAVPGTPSTGGLSAIPGDYVGQLLQIVTGPAAGEAQLITTYNGAGVFTVQNPFSVAPTGVFIITPVNQAAVTLTFGSPLPDDRYTLTVNDSLKDHAGNQLDGESNADQPVGLPQFPSGDGTSGGDFRARFNVDSRPEVATWSQGVVYADINGNFVWDPEGKDNDAVNQDFTYKFGLPSDAYFTGNFSANAAATPGVVGPVGPGPAGASGFDKLGVYGAVAGTYTFALDTNDDGIADTFSTPAFQGNAIPVAGNFDGLPPAVGRSIPVTRSDFLTVRTGTWM